MNEANKKLTIAVTGASGYLGSWIVKSALDAGHTVRGTVRDPDDTERCGHLRALEGQERLSLYRANLLEAGAFDEVTDGADVVIHSASPFVRDNITDPDVQLLQPAVDGTRNVLASVNRNASVRRVVLTSSVAAIMGDAREALDYPDRRVDETRWNRTSTREHETYSYSKTLAERAAWELDGQQERWSLVTINPAFIVGPALSRRLDGTSVSIMRQLGDGSFRQGAPEIYLGFVDVRDVALGHIRAAERENAAGRFILSGRVASFPEIAKILRERIGSSYPFPKGRVPKWLLWIIGPRVGIPRRYVSTNVGIPFEIDNTRSREILGIEYRETSDTVTEHFRQLIEFGAV
ncbi:MAG: NAD-dependent epimerase/dehydratase family protein [Spirochaeta sp.]|jgi:nucleoside-diphosphate-sugar epimerase|nr:NAD-dependent epimerase/dehydratase family protein [Spirochaeta sp.]